MGQLTEPVLIALGIEDKDERNAILDAIKKAGYRAAAVEQEQSKEIQKRRAEGSAPSRPGQQTSRTVGKTKRIDEVLQVRL